VLQTIYGRLPDSECGFAVTGAVVEATVDGGEQRYGVRGEDATIGSCGGGDFPGTVVPGGEGSGGGGSSGPLAAPATGEGLVPTGDHVGWAAAVLAVGGVALCGVGLAVRRRTR
jgi:hypothetical protein